jgi:4-diphosphocytidyl-2-C-methyl-D-erythritol kinase
MSNRAVTMESPAKINLWLQVLGRREDGYHEVRTRMVRTTVVDRVEVERDLGAAKGTGIRLTCSDETLPTDDRNLAVRALKLFQERVGCGDGWRIHLEKCIPAGAGLGGGSGNAAVVLRAANALCDQPLTESELVELAGRIGADVAFFVLDAAAADGVGRGEQVERVAFPHRVPAVLIKPPFPISTPWAYQHWQCSKELAGVLYAPQITPWGALVNDLERPVFEKYALLPALKMWLLAQQECRAALMSGSGSTVFAIASTLGDAHELAGRAQRYVGSSSWVQVAQVGDV